MTPLKENRVSTGILTHTFPVLVAPARSCLVFGALTCTTSCKDIKRNKHKYTVKNGSLDNVYFH